MADSFAISSLLLLCMSAFLSPTWCDTNETSGANLCQGKENSYLWKIDVSPPVYLFGTMHVPYTKLWEYIPDNAKVAFSSSEDLCVELRMSDSSTVEELANCQRLPKDTPIDEVLSSEVRERITNYLERIRKLLPNWLQVSGASSLLGGGAAYSDSLFNAMIGGWETKRPIWILYMLSSLTEENIRLRKIPLLDMFMDNAAQGLGKRVQAIEKAKDTCRPLNKISNEQVELALKVQLDYLEPMVKENSQGPVVSAEEEIDTYRCGDFASLVSSAPFLPLPSLSNITDTSSWLTEEQVSTLKNTEDYLWRQMVVRRNRKMTKQIDALLKKQRNITYFFALGAGHLLSDRNVVDRLRRKGHTVEHISVTRHLEGPSLPSNILELGHPDLVPKLMPIVTSKNDRNKAADILPTLSDDTLAEIWEKYVVNAPKLFTPSSIASSYATTTAPLSTKNTRSVDASVDVEVTDDMWQREVLELMSQSNSIPQATYLNSAHSLYCTSTRQLLLLLILTGLLSLSLTLGLLHN